MKKKLETKALDNHIGDIMTIKFVGKGDGEIRMAVDMHADVSGRQYMSILRVAIRGMIHQGVQHAVGCGMTEDDAMKALLD